MAVVKLNYIVIYEGSPQPYCASSLETIINSPLPKGVPSEERKVLFSTYFPDTKEFKVYEVSEDRIEEEKIRLEEKAKLRDEKRAKRAEEAEEDS